MTRGMDSVWMRTFKDDVEAARFAGCVLRVGGSVLGICYAPDQFGWRVFARFADEETSDAANDWYTIAQIDGNAR